jgi:hypothetical protein
MTINDDMTLSEALAIHGIELKPGSTRCKRKLYRGGEYAGSVNVFQGWNLVAALSARSDSGVRRSRMVSQKGPNNDDC